MAESIKQQLDRVLDQAKDLGATAKQIVLSHEDLDELTGGDAKDKPGAQDAYRDVPVKQGEIGQSSYVETTGGPSGDTNFGV